MPHTGLSDAAPRRHGSLSGCCLNCRPWVSEPEEEQANFRTRFLGAGMGVRVAVLLCLCAGHILLHGVCWLQPLLSLPAPSRVELGTAPPWQVFTPAWLCLTDEQEAVGVKVILSCSGSSQVPCASAAPGAPPEHPAASHHCPWSPGPD